jgi:aryl-alcohol dehydrogenase-like predicted oxidoreductase
MTRISRRRFVSETGALAGASLLAPLAGRLETPVAAAALPTRSFGRTGERVTLVGLGGGSRFYQPITDDEQGAELVRQAIERGINIIETSANYGGPNGDSERRIGLAMKTHRSRVFLETKVDARDHDGAMREMERSLKRLQTDRLDLVLHHNLSSSDRIAQVAGPEGAERAIRRMVEQNVVRFRGFSCHSPAAALEGIERLEPDGMQLIVNATRIPDFETDVLPLAAKRGIGVVVMKSVGHGYFLPRNTTTPDRIDEFGPPADALSRPDLPSAREYLHYALSLPVSAVVVGTDSVATLESILRDALAFQPLSAARMQAISNRAQVFATTGYWLPRARRS